MQIFFLSLLAGETVVGLYGAAVQLLQPFQLISQSLVVAALPSMTRVKDEDNERLQRLTETIISTLLVVAIPLLVGFLFIGGDFLSRIRNGKFNKSVARFFGFYRNRSVIWRIFYGVINQICYYVLYLCFVYFDRQAIWRKYPL